MLFKDKIIILDNVLDKTECLKVIKTFNETGHNDIWNGTLVMDICEDEFVTSIVNKIVNSFLPYNDCLAIELPQVVKWVPGCYQNLHNDLDHKDIRRLTAFTSITYLNEDFVGGETYFEDGTTIKPKIGRTLFFDGVYYRHGVNRVQNGNRFTIPIWYNLK
jgi:Rps23 Pro-64 3,4-dihydroxylase Tpa1-like proline 4-hydroxylase